MNSGSWVAGWYAAPSDAFLSPNLPAGASLRQFLRVHATGQRVRLRLQNIYGKRPVGVDQVWLAKAAGDGAAVDAHSQVAVTFHNGRQSAEIPARGVLVSDPVVFPVASLDKLAVSLHLPDGARSPSRHSIAREMPDLSRDSGAVVQADGSGYRPFGMEINFSWFLLEGVDVESAEDQYSLVTVGDSIAEGCFSLFDAFAGVGKLEDTGNDTRFSDCLAERLHANGYPYSVVNGAISGNRLLSRGLLPTFGPPVIKRFRDDVLALPNIRHALVMIGTNDLGTPPTERRPSTGQMVDGFERVLQQAEEAGVTPLLGTIPPATGMLFGSKRLSFLHGHHKANAVRHEVNAWIRQRLPTTQVADFDKALRDPERPDWLNPQLDSGDYLHPNAAGARVMAECVPLQSLLGHAERSD